VLYALLAGRPPFWSQNPLEVLEQTRHRQPDSLSRQNGRVDRDLETICRKCLEKEPERRYASALALAEDLERWLAGKPIEAQRPGQARRLWLWSRRHPSLAALSALVAVLVPLLMVTLAVSVVVVSKERDVKEWQQQQMRAQREQMRENLYAADMGLAYRAWGQGDMPRLARLLDQWQPQSDASDLRDFAWHFLNSLCSGGVPTPPDRDRAHRGSIYRLAYSPDGQTLASASKDGTVRLKTAGREPVFLRGHTDEVNWVAFDRQGRRLATASDDGTARIWDAASGKEMLCISVPGGEVVAAEFTPDGTVLLTGGHDGHVRQWQLPSGALGQEVLAMPLRRDANKWDSARMVPDRIEGLAVAPDGKHIAVIAKDSGLHVCDLNSDSLRLNLVGEISCVAYSPNGESLAIGDRVGNVRLIHVADGEQEGSYDCDQAEGLAFAPDGRTLAVCGWHGQVRLWDLRTGRPRHKLDTDDVRLWCITFSPDGRTLLAGGDDGVIRSWDLAETRVPEYLPPPAGDVDSLAFTPDGATLAITSRSELVSFWDPYTLRERPGWSRLTFGIAKCGPISFAADGKVLGVLTSAPSTLDVWDPQHHRLIGRRDMLGIGGSLSCRPGSFEWAIGRGYPLLRWDQATGEQVPTGLGNAICTFATWSPDGTVLAVSLDFKEVRLLHRATGQSTSLPAPACACIAFAPDGQMIATGQAGGEIRLWDVSEERPRANLVGHRMGVTSLAFSPDGKVLASGGLDGTARLWHLASGRELFTLPARVGGGVMAVAFAPDGTLLAAAYANRRDRDGVALWRATPP
jgi:WD40 repeat protein